MNLDALFGSSPPRSMKAIRIAGDHKISVIETTVPVPRDDEAVIKPVCCGICGTDLHILRHGFVGTQYPVTPGHEFAGHIVALGKDARGLREGDFVAVDPNVACGGCRWCRMGRPNLCESLTPIGVARPGAAAEYVSAPARNVLPVAESIGHGVAALIEPLACALHAIDSSQGVVDRSALVIGGGTMGLLIAIAARKLGAGRVTIADPAPAKREIARRAGIIDARDPNEIGAEKFDVVFEAAGVKPALDQALGAIEKTGVLVQVGVHEAEATASFQPFRLYEREFRFIGSNSCADKFPDAVALMPDIRHEAAHLLGETFQFLSFDEAVRAMEAGKSVKTQLRFA